jgi:hypothetical protein
VVVTTKLEWRWFIFPHRPRAQVERIDIWSGERWIWRVRALEGQVIELPVTYGELPAGAELVKPAEPLRAGPVYRLEVGRPSLVNSFRIGGNGKVTAANLPYLTDPDLQAENRRTARRVDELRATGMSEAAAIRAFEEEQERGVRY